MWERSSQVKCLHDKVFVSWKQCCPPGMCRGIDSPVLQVRRFLTPRWMFQSKGDNALRCLFRWEVSSKSSSKTSVWASCILQNSFNCCLISRFHILFYFPRVVEALNFERVFWTGKYFSPPALLKSWPWTDDVCKPYQKSVIWVGNYLLSLVEQRKGTCLLGSGKWGLSSVRELRNALFSPRLVLLYSCRSPPRAQHVRHNLQTTTKYIKQRICKARCWFISCTRWSKLAHELCSWKLPFPFKNSAIINIFPILSGF